MSSPTVIACLRYRDAPAALEFLRDAFGFQVGHVSEDDHGRIVHAEMSWRGGMVMLGADRDDTVWDQQPGSGGTYVVLEDGDAVDTCFRGAVAAGATVVSEPREQSWGSKDFVVRDLEGNLWSFGTYQPTTS